MKTYTQKKLLRLLSNTSLIWFNSLGPEDFRCLQITHATPDGLVKIFNLLRKTGFAKNIEILHLSNNNLTCLPEGIFEGLFALLDLYLENNRIRFLPENLFHGLRLRYLNLSHNQISEFSEEQFRDLRTLEHLNLSNNQITQNQYQGLVVLEDLNLSDNQIIDPIHLNLPGLWDSYSTNNFQLTLSGGKLRTQILPDRELPDETAISHQLTKTNKIPVLKHVLNGEGINVSEAQKKILNENLEFSTKCQFPLFQLLKNKPNNEAMYEPKVLGLIQEFAKFR
jgi:hypothetical protein